MNLSHIMPVNKNRVPKVCYLSRWQWQISCEPIRFLVNVSLAHSDWRWSVCSKRNFKVFLFRNWLIGLLQLHFIHHDCQNIFTGWEMRPWLKSSNKTPSTNFKICQYAQKSEAFGRISCKPIWTHNSIFHVSKIYPQV